MANKHKNGKAIPAQTVSKNLKKSMKHPKVHGKKLSRPSHKVTKGV